MKYHEPVARDDEHYPMLDLACSLDGRELNDPGTSTALFAANKATGSVTLEINVKTTSGYRTERQTFNKQQAEALRDFLNANLKGN